MSESLDAMLEDSGLSHLSSKLKSLTISEASQLLSASRPQFLQTLKTLGCGALRERQAVANALGRALRESSAPLQSPTEQLHHRAAAPSTAVPANDGATAAPLAAKLAADVDKAAGAAEGTVMHAHVINLASRPDRLARFSKRWPSQGLASLSVAQAVDGKALLSSRAAPPPPAGCDDALTAALRDDWRSAVCANDAEWGASQPRKLAAVVGCHCSHLNIWESILARERTWGEDTPVFVFEDDATLAVADVGAWFRDVMLPQLPPDWAFCYLNEPLHLEMDRERSHRPRHAQATADAESGSHLDAAIHGGGARVRARSRGEPCARATISTTTRRASGASTSRMMPRRPSPCRPPQRRTCCARRRRGGSSSTRSRTAGARSTTSLRTRLRPMEVRLLPLLRIPALPTPLNAISGRDPR